MYIYCMVFQFELGTEYGKIKIIAIALLINNIITHGMSTVSFSNLSSAVNIASYLEGRSLNAVDPQLISLAIPQNLKLGPLSHLFYN